jgi:hypothetical protein
MWGSSLASHRGDDLLIVNAITHDRGWTPIQHMVAIAGELLGCEVVEADRRRLSSATKLLSVLRKRTRIAAAGETCLIVCAGPGDLSTLLNIANWRKRFRYLAAWVIDSFWLDHIPTSMRLRNPFDHIFVTTFEDVDRWHEITGIPTTWLPWGTDALRLGRGRAERNWDLMRVGRQPPEWEDDIEAALAAEALGIRYRGRPDSTGLNSLQNQKLMMSAYGDSKFTLAFSNAVNRDPNNHPTREYLTGRWVDALGCGSIVAGIAPRGPSMDNLLWDGATLDLGSARRGEGLQVVASALGSWTPDMAAMNYLMALKRLDWRLRFKELAEVCGIRSAALNAELKLLEEQVAKLAYRNGPSNAP